MNLLRAERIKLFSTRAPWWCIGLALIAAWGITALFFALAAGPEVPTNVSLTQVGTGNGRTVLLVLATLAAASEFGWGTLRLTFQAVPKRVPALLAKGAVVGAVGALLGLLVGAGNWAVARLIKPDANLALQTGADWRNVFGQSVVFLLTAVLGVGVGLLLRNVAVSLSVVLVWSLLLEGLIVFIPGVGKHIYQWTPFYAANQFAGADFTGPAFALPPNPLNPWGYLAYFAAICFALFAGGVLLTRHRDA